MSIHKEIKKWDDVEKLDIPFCSFDIELCDKVCCEFISHGVNEQSYEYLVSFLSKRLSKDGFMRKRLRVYTIVDFSFIRTFAPSF